MRKLRPIANRFLIATAVAGAVLWTISSGRPHQLDVGPFWLRVAQVTLEDGTVTWFPPQGNRLAFGWWRLLFASLLGLVLLYRPGVIHAASRSRASIAVLACVTWISCTASLFKGRDPVIATIDVFAVAVGFWGTLRLTVRLLSRPKPIAPGFCRCGYDLRATPDRCPECGAIAPATASK